MKTLNELDLKSKQYIIFDMDGTLIDSIGVWNIIDQKLIKKYANLFIDLETIQQERDNFLNTNLEGNTYFLYSKYLIDRYHFKNMDIEKLTIERRNLANEILGSEIDFKPGVVELIYKLKELGFTIVLATMTTENQLKVYYEKNQKLIKQMNIKETFDSIFKIEDVENKKPHPEIFNKIVKFYDTTPEKCLIFEDSYTGVLAAKKSGIEVVNVYDKYADLDREKINELTDYKIMSYQEIINIVDLLSTHQRKLSK